MNERRPYGGFGRRPYGFGGGRYFFGGPFIGGLAGGLVGSALFRPRPYPYYGGYGGYGYPPYYGGGYYPYPYY